MEKNKIDKFNERMAFISAYQGDILLDAKEIKMAIGVSSDAIVYDLMNLGFLPYLIVGSKKVRRSTLDKFLKDYDGVDLNQLIKQRKGGTNGCI